MNNPGYELKLKAKTVHICDCCEGYLSPGSEYLTLTFFEDSIIRIKLCPFCFDLYTSQCKQYLSGYLDHEELLDVLRQTYQTLHRHETAEQRADAQYDEFKLSQTEDNNG